jgi:hypothetical protein
MVGPSRHTVIRPGIEPKVRNLPRLAAVGHCQPRRDVPVLAEARRYLDAQVAEDVFSEIVVCVVEDCRPISRGRRSEERV